jgi:6-phosphogluconolactonase
MFRTSQALVQAAAERFVSSAAAALRASGRFAVALSGGSTPTSLYALLAKHAYATRIDWSRVQVFWGDERCVPPASLMSNYRMAREALLDHVPVPHENVHRIRGEDAAAAAAAAYERELRDVFRTPQGAPMPRGRFDLVLLGLGGDGHTASLFPGQAAVSETERWVVAEYVPKVSMWRVTLTPVLINAAAEVVFLVSGREKAATLRRVLDGPYQPGALPAQAIAPRGGQLRWLVDAAAAANLQGVEGR